MKRKLMYTAGLLMAAAIPRAFGADGVLFAGTFVTLQVGRSAAAAYLLRKDHPLHDVFHRVAAWSGLGGVLWLAGSALDGDKRLLLWAPALLVEFCAPVAGYWLPGRGHAVESRRDDRDLHLVAHALVEHRAEDDIRLLMGGVLDQRRGLVHLA